MATIVNNPPATQESDSGTGFLLGTVLVIAFIAVMLYFGIPALQRTMPAGTQPANEIVPGGTTDNNTMTAPDIKIPDQIDVNVNQPQNEKK